MPKKSHSKSKETQESKKPLIGDRERAYYWKGVFDMYRRIRTKATNITRHDPVYKQGWEDAAQDIRSIEIAHYDMLKLEFSDEELHEFIMTQALPTRKEEDGQGIEEKAYADRSDIVLYKLGPNIYYVREGGQN